MRLVAKNLKSRADEAGVGLEQLADGLVSVGLGTEAAERAVRNWMAGRDHPRCKRAHIEALAQAIGCQPKDIARFTSAVRWHRGSPKKAKLVVDLVRGKSVDDAMNLLTFTTKRAAVNVKKALTAALADAEQQGADVANLYVSECRVDKGVHIKRFQPKDRGRAHPILKRTSHITLSVQERS